jgi:hypothetical protein
MVDRLFEHFSVEIRVQLWQEIWKYCLNSVVKMKKSEEEFGMQNDDKVSSDMESLIVLSALKKFDISYNLDELTANSEQVLAKVRRATGKLSMLIPMAMMILSEMDEDDEESAAIVKGILGEVKKSNGEKSKYFDPSKLVFAGRFHGLYAIADVLAPGISELRFDSDFEDEMMM